MGLPAGASFLALPRSFPGRTNLSRRWREGFFPSTDPVPEKLSIRLRLSLLAVAATSGFLFFFNLSYPFLEPDEARYAEISREMVAANDWVVPRLYHQPYLDKPPLFYWLVGLSLKVFGHHEWAARLIPSLAGFFTILLTFYFGRRLVGNRAALFGAAVLAFTAGFVVCGRTLIFDGLLTLFVSIALFAGYESIRGPAFRWRWWLVSAAACALGVLLKGPVALILGWPPLMACLGLGGSLARVRPRHWFAYLAVILALVVPWFIAIMQACPEFAYYFFVYHHFVRYFGTEHHSNPIWYYIPVLFVGYLPWSFMLAPLTWFLGTRNQEMKGLRTRGMGFLVLWMIWCLGFFSISRGKLPPYILPAFPALALLLGRLVEAMLCSRSCPAYLQRVRERAPVQVIVILAAICLGLGGWGWWHGMYQGARLTWQVALTLLCVLSLSWIALRRRAIHYRASWKLAAVLTTALLFEITGNFIPAWSGQRTPFARARDLALLLRQEDIGVVNMSQWATVPFRLEETVAYFDGQYAGEQAVQRFLLGHKHNLVFTERDWPEENVFRLVPRGMEVARIFISGKARVYVIRTGARPTQL
jgi:4-amino-4-deoxy-L-arabinose transferase-like glycosyltransferase